MFAKWHDVNGVKCQGFIEKRVAVMLQRDKTKCFYRGKAQKTPNGNYTPDFDLGWCFLEIKSMHSWLQALGVVSIIENARNEKLAEITNKSQLKMEYVNEKVKPVYVFIELTEESKKFKDIKVPDHSLTTVYGSVEDLHEFLRINKIKGNEC
jgi:hypothetical protein